MTVEDLAITLYAQRKGIPPDQAKALLEVLKEKDEPAYKDVIESFGALVGSVSSLPPATQQAVFGAATPMLVDMTESNPKEEKVEGLALLAKFLGGDNDRIAALEKKLDDVLQDKQRAAFEEIIQKNMDQVNAQIASLHAEIEQSKAQSPSGSPAEALVSQLQQAEQIKKQLADLLMGGQQPQHSLEEDVKKAEEILTQRGYYVKRPATADELESILKASEEKWKADMDKAVKDAIDRTKKDIYAQVNREKMLTDFAANIFSAVLENLGEGEKAGIASIVKKGLGALRAAHGAGAATGAAAAEAAGTGA